VEESWRSRAVEVELPTGLWAAMASRAHRWGIDRGGRFQAGKGLIIVCSNSMSAGPPTALGVVWASTEGPDASAAVIRRIGWNAAASSEIETWAAVKVLAGKDWPAILEAVTGRRS